MTFSIRHLFPTARKLSLCLLSMFLVSSSSSVGLAYQDSDGEENDAITMAPRALRRLITTAEDAINAKRYAEAVETLGKILMEEVDELDAQAEEYSQDYFLERRTSGLIKGSVRSRAADLLESVPAENRDAIELRYGVIAKQQLDEAVSRFDWNAIEAVSRRFFHTSAGYDATLLVAQRYRTDGRPMSAALMGERLLTSPGAQRKFGSKIFFYTADCWLEAGRSDNAMKVVLTANEKFAGSTIDWKGKSTTIGPNKVWTESDFSLMPRSPVSGELSKDWRMAGGTPTRNGDSAAALTMPSPSWQTPVTRGRPDEVRLKSFIEGRNPSAPALIGNAIPAVVGDTIIYKTIDHSLRGIDVVTGKVKWEQSLTSSPWEASSNLNQFAMDMNISAPDQLAERVWSHVPYWQISTDGEKAFLVSKPSEADGQNKTSAQLRQQFLNLGIVSHNYLEAFSIKGQGKAIWRVGGDSGVDEPKLAGAYFLGAPLWIDGSLYCIANLNGETTFLSLDPETGLVQWMQQLAQSPKQGFGDTSGEDAANIYLAYADGIVICPTGTGVLVAIDVASRSLRWAFRYRDVTQVAMSRGGPFNSPIRREVDPLVERRWTGLPVIIADSRIILASAESDQLFCLDLINGDLQWTQRRDPYRYVGGVFDNRVFLVGDKSVIALNLSDGKLAWPSPLTLPNNKLVTGLGVRRNGSYFLPLQSQEVMEIDITQGRLLGTAKADVPLGNLVAFREQVLSVSPFGMALFSTQKDLKQAVNQRLAANNNDPWALARLSELQMLEGKDSEALDTLRLAFKSHPQNDEIRFLMIRSILKALDSDFIKYQSLASEIEPLIELRPQRIDFLNAMCKGFLKSDTPEKAVDPMLQIIDIRSRERSSSISSPVRILQLEPGHNVDLDAWLKSQVTTLYNSLSADKRDSFKQRILQYFEATNANDLLTRTHQLKYFQELNILAPVSLEVAAAWIDRGTGKGWLQAEELLTPLITSPTSPPSSKGQELLLKLYEASGNKYAKQNLQALLAIQGSSTDTPFTTALSQLNFEIAKSILWPNTKAKIELKTAESGMFRPATSPAKLAQTRSIPLAGFEARDGSDRVVLTGPDGRESLVVNCDASDGRVGSEARMIRSFLVIQRRTQIAVIDTLGNYNDSRDALLWKIERFSPEALTSRPSMSTQTRANTLGLEIARVTSSTESVARLGPVFDHCVIIVRGGTIQALNLLTGAVLWSRDGIGSTCEFAQSGELLVVLDSANKKRLVVNALDGRVVSNDNLDTTRTFLNNWHEFVIDFKVEATGSANEDIPGVSKKQVVLRLWNAITGETALERTVTSDAKANFGDSRYFAILEPNGNFCYWDCATQKETVHELAPSEKLRHIYLVPVYDRFLLLTESSKYELDDVQIAPSQSTTRTHFVNGHVFALDHKDGKPLWSKPANMLAINVAKLQSRYSPILAFYRIIDWRDANLMQQDSASVALMDVRDGNLIFKSNVLDLLRTETTGMESFPEQKMLQAKHGQRLLQITWTDEPAEPAEIANFGEMSHAKILEEAKSQPQNSGDTTTPFDIFRDIDPPSP